VLVKKHGTKCRFVTAAPPIFQQLTRKDGSLGINSIAEVSKFDGSKETAAAILLTSDPRAQVAVWEVTVTGLADPIRQTSPIQVGLPVQVSTLLISDELTVTRKSIIAKATKVVTQLGRPGQNVVVQTNEPIRGGGIVTTIEGKLLGLILGYAPQRTAATQTFSLLPIELVDTLTTPRVVGTEFMSNQWNTETTEFECAVSLHDPLRAVKAVRISANRDGVGVPMTPGRYDSMPKTGTPLVQLTEVESSESLFYRVRLSLPSVSRTKPISAHQIRWQIVTTDADGIEISKPQVSPARYFAVDPKRALGIPFVDKWDSERAPHPNGGYSVLAEAADVDDIVVAWPNGEPKPIRGTEKWLYVPPETLNQIQGQYRNRYAIAGATRLRLRADHIAAEILWSENGDFFLWADRKGVVHRTKIDGFTDDVVLPLQTRCSSLAWCKHGLVVSLPDIHCIAVVDARTLAVKQLIAVPEAEHLTSSRATNIVIATCSFRGNRTRFMHWVDLDRGEVKRIDSQSFSELAIRWRLHISNFGEPAMSADGKYLFFCSTAMHRFRVEDRELVWEQMSKEPTGKQARVFISSDSSYVVSSGRNATIFRVGNLLIPHRKVDSSGTTVVSPRAERIYFQNRNGVVLDTGDGAPATPSQTAQGARILSLDPTGTRLLLGIIEVYLWPPIENAK
jgi:hypothetical protein